MEGNSLTKEIVARMAIHPPPVEDGGLLASHVKGLLNFMNYRYEEYKSEFENSTSKHPLREIGIKLIQFIKDDTVTDEVLVFNVSVYIASFQKVLIEKFNDFKIA